MSNDVDGRMLDQALVVYKAPVLAVDICVVIVCAQATCMHSIINWSDYMSYCYKKCDGYRLSWAHVSLLFDLLPMM
jgi:hypothetical protein